jgi:hypothetical protein
MGLDRMPNSSPGAAVKLLFFAFEPGEYCTKKKPNKIDVDLTEK